MSPDELQRNAAASMKRGFRAFKLRISGRIADDVAKVRAVREAVGPDAGILCRSQSAHDRSQRHPPRPRTRGVQSDVA